MPSVAAICAVLLVASCIIVLVSETAEFFVLLRGAAAARRYRSAGFAGDALLKSPLAPAVAVAVTPADASQESRRQVRRLLQMRSGNAEVVVVLDAPSNAERALWMEEFHLQPVLSGTSTECVRGIYRSRDPIALRVIDRAAGTIGDRLNTVLSLTDAPVMAVADQAADVLEDALLTALERFLAGSERVVALCVAGPADAVSGLPALLYRVEFLRSWLARCALAAWNSALPLPGSLTLFDREAVLRLGGFRGGTLDMVMRLHQMVEAAKSAERIVFLPVPSARALVPRSWKASRMARARIRSEERQAVWVSGLIQYYMTPAAFAGMVGSAALGLLFSWMEPGVVLPLIGATLLFRALKATATVLVGEYASPTEGRPLDLAALCLAAVWSSRN